ncbi:hypothetical protein [Mucilaginibacter polytrichastri]|nr:hypothetical protein [Mucilaginibacter polytrichastri]SFS36671.1 hypothetical protein SAMN04487890_10197 [Mucilaginibacter polytrichastri]
MKKIIFLLMLTICVASMSFAQQVVVKDETKTKRTSTLPQKIHNVFHKKKHYSGYKTKHVVKKAKV